MKFRLTKRRIGLAFCLTGFVFFLSLWAINFWLWLRFWGFNCYVTIYGGGITGIHYSGAATDMRKLGGDAFGGDSGWMVDSITELHFLLKLKPQEKWLWNLGFNRPRFEDTTITPATDPRLTAPVRNVRLQIPLWLPTLFFSLPLAWLWWQGRRRIPLGHCQKCGYNLTGNVSGVCSECGMVIRATNK